MHRRVGGPPGSGFLPQRPIPVATQAREHGPLYFTTGQGARPALCGCAQPAFPTRQACDRPPAPPPRKHPPNCCPTRSSSANHRGDPAARTRRGPDAQSGRCKGARAGVGGAQSAGPPSGVRAGRRLLQPGGLRGASLAARGRPTACAPSGPRGDPAARVPGLAGFFPREPQPRSQVGAAGPGQRPLGSGSGARCTSVLPASRSWEKEGWGGWKNKRKSPCTM